MLGKLLNFLPPLLDSTIMKGEVPKDIMETLKKKFPEIPPEQVVKIVDTFLELLKKHWEQPVFSLQQQKIQHSVAEMIQKHFKLLNLKLDSDVENVAFHLCNKNDPEEKGKLSQHPVSPKDMKLAEENIIGIDVIYERISSSQWERTTRIFVRSVGKNMEYSQSVKLEWDSLPSEVRNAVLKTREQKQRFILYNPKERE